MNRLKILIIITVSTSIVPLYATINQELEKVKKTMEDTKQQVHLAAQEITETHGRVQTQLLDKVNNALEQNINPQARRIANNIDDIKDMGKQIALSILGDANPIAELRWMLDNPIRTVTETLQATKTIFENLNNDINPKADPKGIYADLRASEESFAKAIKNIEDGIFMLKSVNL